jgi:putative FmdB family regulatory protein
VEIRADCRYSPGSFAIDAFRPSCDFLLVCSLEAVNSVEADARRSGCLWHFKNEEAQVMPLFDFRCRSCGSEFEALVRASDLPVCPSCKSAKLEQLPSMFTVSSLEITKARVRTAKKERRRSRAYRDKIMSDREVKHHD